MNIVSEGTRKSIDFNNNGGRIRPAEIVVPNDSHAPDILQIWRASGDYRFANSRTEEDPVPNVLGKLPENFVAYELRDLNKIATSPRKIAPLAR